MPRYMLNDEVRLMSYNPDGTVRYTNIRIIDVRVSEDLYVYKFLTHTDPDRVGKTMEFPMWEVERASELVSHGANTVDIWDDINE